MRCEYARLDLLYQGVTRLDFRLVNPHADSLAGKRVREPSRERLIAARVTDKYLRNVGSQGAIDFPDQIRDGGVVQPLDIAAKGLGEGGFRNIGRTVPPVSQS